MEKKNTTTKKPATKNAVAEKKPAAKTTAIVEEKVEKVAFDRKALYGSIQKAFAKSPVVDILADTDREESINAAEYEYIHYYRKGTDRNIFQLYIKTKNSVFVVGNALAGMLDQKSDKYTMTPIQKTRKNKDGSSEKKTTCYAINCKHEDTVEVSNILVEMSMAKAAEKVEKKAEKKGA